MLQGYAKEEFFGLLLCGMDGMESYKCDAIGLFLFVIGK